MKLFWGYEEGGESQDFLVLDLHEELCTCRAEEDRIRKLVRKRTKTPLLSFPAFIMATSLILLVPMGLSVRGEDIVFCLMLLGALALGLALMDFLFKRREQWVREDPEILSAMDKNNAAIAALRKRLGVGKSARNVEMFSVGYSSQDDGVYVRYLFVRRSDVWTEDGMLYFVNPFFKKYAVELRELRGIRRGARRLQVFGPIDSQQSALYEKQDKKWYLSDYCIVSLEHDGEEWEIYIHGKECEFFESLLEMRKKSDGDDV